MLICSQVSTVRRFLVIDNVIMIKKIFTYSFRMSIAWKFTAGNRCYPRLESPECLVSVNTYLLAIIFPINLEGARLELANLQNK